MNQINTISPDLIADLQAAAINASKGIRNLEEMLKASSEMDQLREKNRQAYGSQDVGVGIIREMRDGK